MPVLLRETTGDKSGQPRSVGLSHIEQVGRFFVVASYAGQEREAVFRRFVEADAAFGDYRARTAGEVPVFERRPEGS